MAPPLRKGANKTLQVGRKKQLRGLCFCSSYLVGRHFVSPFSRRDFVHGHLFRPAVSRPIIW